MDKKLLIGLGASLVLLAGGAIASEPEERERVPSFEELDRDGNGYLSESEVSGVPCLHDNFDRIQPENEEGMNRQEYRQGVAQFCK
ncbi:hypothetical protein J2T60_000995 [Natronospira proteinivora]|uniref:EF-hand domain-containing protein n=1 Tax=Natronospira proteinivora TaxID=1807133 RepID=A0ABT1G7V6_9GAMM|nr:hypothetical protein [Natronospira proteinivora]MCP1727030.1 hypothetical protein [Natronospira proteinivora]